MPEPTPRTFAALYQIIQDHRDDADDGHKRLRNDIRILQKSVEALEHERNVMRAQIQDLESNAKQPTEVSELRFTPTMVFAICAGCASIIGGSYAVNSGQRTDIQGVKSQIEAYTKIQDERMGQVKAALDAVERRQQLQQIDLQNLKETVIRKGSER